MEIREKKSAVQTVVEDHRQTPMIVFKRDLRQVSKRALRLTPHALGALVVASHASEFTRIVSHASTQDLLVAGALLTAWVYTRGTEEL